jgi:hypothetical protein
MGATVLAVRPLLAPAPDHAHSGAGSATNTAGERTRPSDIAARDHRPMIVARRLDVRPPYERASPRISIDHPTTPTRSPALRSVARPSPAAVPTPAAVFSAELVRHGPPDRPRPIPMSYRPLATAIVGERPVHVSTGRASRRALARVGKRAATTGDTIHLDTPRPAPEVIAHELTHVAHPSPVPRFFDDDDRGPEERQAEQVAAIMRRAPILARPAAAARPREPGTISADALAASITGSGGDQIQRFIGGHRRGRAATAPPPSTSLPVTSAPATAQQQQSLPATQPEQPAPQAEATATAPTLDIAGQFDRLLELLEDRIITELERRGGRFRGGF